MNKYHINPETFEPGVCKAKIKCSFDNGNGEPVTHYENLEEAVRVSELMLKNAHGAFKTNRVVNDIRNHPDFGKIDQEVEIDISFAIDENGNVVDTDDVVPEVYYYGNEYDIDISDAWEPISGFSGQQGYDGPVMHASEVMSGSDMEAYVREHPGTYAIVQPYDGNYDDTEEGTDEWYDDENRWLDGWMLIRKQVFPKYEKSEE